MKFLGLFRQGGRAIFFGVALLCVVAIGILAVEIVRDLRLLNDARSDNVQWTLSQAEVEFLELLYEVEHAQLDQGADLDSLKEEYDIFYSRIQTLANSRIYTDLRGLPDFGAPLARIQQTLAASVPLIDGPTEALIADLPRLEDMLHDVRADLRALATSGLDFFARQSDAQRNSVAVTLMRLALLTVILVLVLLFLLRLAQTASRQTERRGHELSAAYARLNTILDTSLDAVIVADMKGDIQRFNPAAERIFKYQTQDVIGRNIGALIVPEHLRAAHDAGMARMHKTGERRVVGHGRVRLEGMRSTGEIFPVELALESANTGSEEIVIGFLRDISHRVAAENELVEARDKALAGEQAKADFLAMMTHEIRTPLNGVLGNLSLLEETPLTPVQSRYVHNMAVSGKLLMSHVDAVLDIARFESGASTSQEETVHIGRLVQDIVDSQTSAAEANDNVLEWGWVGRPADWILVDSSRLQQVLLNLIGNAIKFTRHGRIQVEIERCEPEEAGGNELCLDFRIIDTGIGIADEDLDRVFEDFQTSGSKQDHGLPGTGLGLGIARRFVTAMGGEIGAESTVGEGSVFWLRLPVVLSEPQQQVEQAPKPAGPVVDRNILLVEDNEINLQLARDMLTLLGHRVSVARDGREGVEAAEAERYDLILMDIRMPVMDGLAATKAIREGQGASRDVPIVALSANVLPEAKERFIKSGMSDFLGKPLMKDELTQVIARFCKDAPPSAEPKPQAVAPEPVADDPIAALMARYLDETRALFDWLESKPGDWTEIANRAHRIAGSAAAFGQPDLRMALLKVETAAEAEDAPALADAVVKARKAWAEAPEPSVA
ncbi:ATP-binding protein [Mameliella sediminis]|uniref:ATP-binding protein n=1 Tax=Mameliella sediminis TaxID=2836866 RepID=UPI001C44A0DB|nr:ATP-binding protein [Mameliella sediminis]MBV7393634.1 response regulator [Mameliella sediminis]